MSSNANAEEAVMPRSVAVTVAHELLTAGHRYLDVRTVKEFSGGHAVEGCLSGKRSLMAASELSNAGFTGITDVAGGFSAWVENGLPTEQKEPVRQSTCFL
uniref:Rhodanese domain-containing protein n=1 Tax=Musa acuminata subsp. malaccensis TaxID=214687 RepID=A0A804LA27_MUSAM|nr:PREDICTED: thiosulfate sulfurtransferase 16, chloroplastic-like [Musa acuminata subsp. malaccensis]